MIYSTEELQKLTRDKLYQIGQERTIKIGRSWSKRAMIAQIVRFQHNTVVFSYIMDSLSAIRDNIKDEFFIQSEFAFGDRWPNNVQFRISSAVFRINFSDAIIAVPNTVTITGADAEILMTVDISDPECGKKLIDVVLADTARQLSLRMIDAITYGKDEAKLLTDYVLNNRHLFNKFTHVQKLFATYDQVQGIGAKDE